MHFEFILNILVPMKEASSVLFYLGKAHSIRHAKSVSFQDCPRMSSSFLKCDIIWKKTKV